MQILQGTPVKPVKRAKIHHRKSQTLVEAMYDYSCTNNLLGQNFLNPC